MGSVLLGFCGGVPAGQVGLWAGAGEGAGLVGEALGFGEPGQALGGGGGGPAGDLGRSGCVEAEVEVEGEILVESRVDGLPTGHGAPPVR